MSSGEYDCQLVFVTNETAVLNARPSGTGRQAERVGQHRLQALQRVDEQDAHDREDQHAAQVGLPGLSGCRIHADQPIDAAFDPQVFAALVDVGDVVAQRPVEQGEDQDERGELEDAEPDRLGGDAAHQKRSGFTRAKTR